MYPNDLYIETSHNVWGRKMWSLNFGVLEVKKFKFVGAWNLGHTWTNWSVSQKVQIFGERSVFMKCVLLYGCLNGGIQIFGEKSILIKCSMLYGCLNGSIWFLIFKKNSMVFRWGQSLGTNLGFLESIQILASFMCILSDKFQCTDNFGVFGCFLRDYK